MWKFGVFNATPFISQKCELTRRREIGNAITGTTGKMEWTEEREGFGPAP